MATREIASPWTDSPDIRAVPSDTGFISTVPRSWSHLTAHEQSIVALSLFDHPSTISPPTRAARIIRLITGNPPPNCLADRRLELLRCYCIELRVHGANASDDRKAQLLAAGFSDDALLEIARRIVPPGSRAEAENRRR